MPKPSILIVEDDPQLNLIFTLTLQSEFEITSMIDGRQALDFLRSTSPDMVILDLNLPGASGRQILDYIRSEKHLTGVRIILATADAAWADELSSQADLILLKPISPIQLRDLAIRFSDSTFFA